MEFDSVDQPFSKIRIVLLVQIGNEGWVCRSLTGIILSQKDRTFHYLPYHTDSRFEQDFLNEVLTFPEVERLGLEVYYNGDRVLTEFKIKCSRNNRGLWEYVGMYTPDFLILQRKDDVIKVLIAETKGKI